MREWPRIGQSPACAPDVTLPFSIHGIKGGSASNWWAFWIINSVLLMHYLLLVAVTAVSQRAISPSMRRVITKVNTSIYILRRLRRWQTTS